MVLGGFRWFHVLVTTFPCRALVTMPHMERSKIVFFSPH